MSSTTSPDGEVTVRHRGLPEEQAAELMRLAEQNGRALTPELVVEASRDKNSPLHDRIWAEPDRVAAARWRLHEARKLIRAFRLEIATAEGLVVVPRFVGVTTEGGARYRAPIEDVLSDEARRQQAVSDTRRQLEGLRKRLVAFGVASSIVDILSTALEELEELGEDV